MNLDTISFSNKINKAATRVMSPSTESAWMLLGYADTDKMSSIMTIDVVREGSVWRDLLDSFADDEIQYGYAKLEFEHKSHLFLIHWVGKEISENSKLSRMPHLNEIRNLIPIYDLLVNSMDKQDIQSRVHGYLTRTQTLCVHQSIVGNYRHSALLRHPELENTDKKTSKRTSSIRVKTRRRANTVYIEESEKKIPEKTSAFTSYITQTGNKPKVKVTIVGSQNVGKSSIYTSYNGEGFSLQSPNTLKTTISADLMSKDVTFGKHNFTLMIWDTAGQERFASLTSTHTRNAKVIICVYDIADKLSFKEIPRHMQAAKEHSDPRAIFFLVGNKADLVHRREVREAEGERFATQHDMTFMECSGLTGLNILKLFENITKHVVFTYQDIFEFPEKSSNDIIRVTPTTTSNTRKGCQRCNQ